MASRPLSWLLSHCIHLELKMSRTIYFSNITLALTLLASCGLKLDKKNDKQDDIRPETSSPSSDIRWLAAEDPNCMTSGTSTRITSATIYQWDGLQTSPKAVQIPGATVDDKEFATQNILASAINYSQNYKCTINEAGERKCVNATKDNTSYKWLRICRSNATYARDSLEAMTLTAMYFTESAYRFYNSIAGNMSGISKSLLISQPKITREIIKTNGEVKNRVDSDNAAFAELPASGNSPSYGLFMIYPTTQGWFTRNKNNLWEIPFVMNHEFGHHVFSHYIKESAESTGLTIKARNGLDSIMPNRDNELKQRMSLTTDTAQLALDGVNEAFADLYAYFAGNSARDQLKGIECLAISRDPASAVTRAGQQKGLDQSRIDIYEGRRSSTSANNDCYEPSYDDEHDIAVALGQPLARFIETMAPQAQGKDRARYLLVWASRMQTLLNQGRSNVTVDTLVRELILGAKSFGNSSLACRELMPRISGLSASVAACNQ